MSPDERLQGAFEESERMHCRDLQEEIDQLRELHKAAVAEAWDWHDKCSAARAEAGRAREALRKIREVRSCLGAGPMDYEAFVDEVYAALDGAS